MLLFWPLIVTSSVTFTVKFLFSQKSFEKEKTVYYPSLKQTVKQKVEKDEANILAVFNKIARINGKKTQTKNGDTFHFSGNWLTSITSKGYTVNFSDYKLSNGYYFPTKISVKDGSSQIIYRLSDFR